MGLLDDLLEVIVEEICQEIAESFVSEAIDTMWGMVANDGQESLISEIEGDYADQVEGVSEGDFEPVESSHPEAVGIITDTGNAICSAGAEICNQIRNAASLEDLFG